MDEARGYLNLFLAKTGTQVFSDVSRLNCHSDILVMDAEVEAHNVAG